MTHVEPFNPNAVENSYKPSWQTATVYRTP